MSLRDCINNAVAGGELDQQRADRILSEYDNAFREFQKSMGYTQAEVEAARAVAKAAKIAAADKRRVAQLQAAASLRQVQRLQDHTNIRGIKDPAQYLRDLISNRRGARGSTLAGKYEAVRRDFRAEMTDAIKTFRANLLGMRRKKDVLDDVVREVFGQDTGNAHARAIAQAWQGVAEKARTRFNAAGGHIGKLSDWGLPQMHSMDKVRRVSYEDWRAEILPRLDLQAMGERFNDGLPFTEQSVEALLRDAYEAIRTDGMSRRKPQANYGSALYNRRADHRFFKFKSADDWSAYNAKFGAGRDAFRVMIGHLDNMAMDIAMMEELGPNPMHTFRYLSDAAQNEAAKTGGPDAIGAARRKAASADDMMDLFTGKTNMPQDKAFARGAAALRNYLSAAHLGSALWSSVTDFNTQQMAAGFVGLPRLGSVKQLMKLAVSPSLRDVANDAGLIFENAVDIGNAVARYELEDMHVEAASRMADFTIRASGLGWLTEMQRQAHGLVIMNGAATDWVGKSFDQLSPETQRFFTSYGISKADWSLMRRAKIHTTDKGLQLLRPRDIADAAGQGVADRFMEAIVSSTEFAVPTTDLFGRSVVLGRTKPGTLGGEFLRFGLQFKAFPVTMLVTQFGRIMAEHYQGRPGTALSYAAGLVIGNTLLGAVAAQMKEVSKGRDPRDMTTGKFWQAAFLQGGGLGIFGDFFFSDVNRFGGGIGQTLSGPGVNFLDDMMKFTVGNVQQAAAGENTNMGREFVNLLRRYTPGGSLWYVRAAFEREILDQLQQMMDPKAARDFHRKIKSAGDFDTSYFYPPGSSAMLGKGRVRAPNLANAFGG